MHSSEGIKELWYAKFLPEERQVWYFCQCKKGDYYYLYSETSLCSVSNLYKTGTGGYNADRYPDLPWCWAFYLLPFTIFFRCYSNLCKKNKGNCKIFIFIFLLRITQEIWRVGQCFSDAIWCWGLTSCPPVLSELTYIQIFTARNV